MFGHDRGRGVSDEVFIGQFLPHRHELGFHLRDFFPEPFTFRCKIDQSFQRQIKFPQPDARQARLLDAAGRRPVVNASSSGTTLEGLRTKTTRLFEAI